MKKTALFAALGALAVASSANAGWYAQGDLGFSKVKFSEYSALDSSKMDPRFSLGYSLEIIDWQRITTIMVTIPATIKAIAFQQKFMV